MNNLKALRLHKGLTGSVVAREARIDLTTYQRIETRRINPNDLTALRAGVVRSINSTAP